MTDYCAATSKITGFLIDLDGTMYSPSGLLPGARAFYAWLNESGHPFAFLSNTGAKGSMQVQQKFMTPPFELCSLAVQLRHIFTAAEAQMQLLSDIVPEGGRLYVMAGGDGSWINALRMTAPLLVDSWEIRTHLTEPEAKEWAKHAQEYRAVHGRAGVFVVHFTDGTVSKMVDPRTGQSSYADWNYSVFRKSTYLLTHGAMFVYTADDAYNPSVDPDFPGMMFALPGPGMFAAAMRKVMYPAASLQEASSRSAQESAAASCDGVDELSAEGEFIACAGKGGNRGGQYMMQHALSMLRQQGHDGRLDQVLMIGDRFDTDIRGGRSVGIETCLVESGCHSREMQRFFPTDRATYFASGVEQIVPPEFLRKFYQAEVDNGVHDEAAQEYLLSMNHKQPGSDAGMARKRSDVTRKITSISLVNDVVHAMNGAAQVTSNEGQRASPPR
mmetsp:Transcript_8626/g.18410  ORF Transcript_8626/g.18410 Transcript_8626/m.18410 type:complete len:443 (-) Transcript_8626:146-1474(-)|eukprot:CAMPEP_0185852306 /NCGR_PEP_ID=MMETSP1354-20130828/14149_1 /TAXON_ID=708628 /ORGANISM="Erythrolobus madagascarensis, Strain CCMP3276" /LENGTH=442 /DNA_ID=CAMNT_0028553513 /DNA_START=200 /DNA_END=1528 /DNA_ORIENTATION=+